MGVVVDDRGSLHACNLEHHRHQRATGDEVDEIAGQKHRNRGQRHMDRRAVEKSPMESLALIAESFSMIAGHHDDVTVDNIYTVLVAAADAGAACLRINPGNIGNIDRVREVVRAAEARKVPISLVYRRGLVRDGTDAAPAFGLAGTAAPLPTRCCRSSRRASSALISRHSRS